MKLPFQLLKSVVLVELTLGPFSVTAIQPNPQMMDPTHTITTKYIHKRTTGDSIRKPCTHMPTCLVQ